MNYEHKSLSVDKYINSLYSDGLQISKTLNTQEIRELILDIGIFKLKGYAKAFRGNLSKFSIDDLFSLYNADREMSSNMFKLSSKIEVKLKAYLIEIVYELTDNPFFYLVKENYIEDFTINNESLYDWEVKPKHPKQKSEIYLHYRDYYLLNYNFQKNKAKYLVEKELIRLTDKININYPPFHYFVENITLGALIKIVSKLTIENKRVLKLVANRFNILNPQVFLNYLLRVKEIRNRSAHNGRLFNRNYRGVKAYGKHKEFRKIIFEHKLIDVYYSLYLLLDGKNRFNSVEELIEIFKVENFLNCDENVKDWIIQIMKTG